jgi:lysophospholipase L1-like esterase
MRKTLSVLVLTTLCAVNGLFAATPPADLRELVECTPRDGWPHFFEKLDAGEPVTVAYLGGSITAQAGWRVQTLDWLRSQYPEVKFTEVNAAIGGTGSDLGVFRLQKDVLDHHPDLLLVEFAVNDGSAPADKIRKAMEGIVRQTLAVDPDCDIGFVYTLTKAFIDTLSQDKMTASASAMEDVADHYGLPSIQFGDAIIKLYKDGKIEMVADESQLAIPSGDTLNEQASAMVANADKIPFSRDGVHPYPNTGHVLYTQAFIRSFPLIEAASVGNGSDGLPAPLDPANWEDAQMIPLVPGDSISLTGPTEELDLSTDPVGKRFQNRMRTLWKLSPGSELTFKFKGTKVMIYDLKGSGCDAVEVELDGKTRTIDRFDGYCTYDRISAVNVGDNLPDTVHTVKIRPLAGTVDKAKVLFEKNRPDMEKNPDKYAASDWYAGELMLVGELVSLDVQPTE